MTSPHRTASLPQRAGWRSPGLVWEDGASLDPKGTGVAGSAKTPNSLTFSQMLLPHQALILRSKFRTYLGGSWALVGEVPSSQTH